MIDTVALREKVLDLAIRGKLVPQDPSDEPASVLLERIRAQKQQMVKEGKLKAKDIKDDSIIFVGEDNLHYEKFADGTVKCIEDEIPFELPMGWLWCRLSMIGTTNIGLTYKPTDVAEEGTMVLRSCNIKNGKIDLSDLIRVKTVIRENQYIENNDILICARNGSKALVGKCAVIQGFNEKASFGAFMAILRSECYQYVYHFLNTSFFRLTFDNDDSKQINQLTQAMLKDALIPLPPFAEQQRIVGKLEELLNLVESIDIGVADVEQLISLTKSKILDLAIRGKLVPQNPEDEPASVLLERIRAEKEELIRQGKIKRDKKESIIYKGEDNSYYEKIGQSTCDITDEIPFDLPQGMEFVRYKSIWELISGRDLMPSEYNDNGNGIPYITGASNFSNGNIEIVRWTQSPQVITQKGDLLITCKGTVGEIAVNDFGDAHIARQVMAMRNLYGLNLEYLSICIRYHIETIKTVAKGLIPGISREDVLELLIPVPSVEYQKRVVQRVNELFVLITSIEKSLD